jgi:hypothetical protein
MKKQYQRERFRHLTLWFANWETETKSKFTPEQIGIAKKIAQEQGGDEFVKLLEETKFGSHQ